MKLIVKFIAARLAVLLVPCALLLAGCSGEGSPLSAFGIGPSAPKEAIEYSPRPPLAIPPPEQRSQLPPPQDQAQTQATARMPQDPPLAMPPAYGAEATVPESAAKEDAPWWETIFD